jgi:ribose 5-phosphate isomerase B
VQVAIGADHAGAPLVPVVEEAVRAAGHEPVVIGEPVAGDDYPDVALAVGRAVLDERAGRGILVCGSGAGVAVAANKLHGIRAGVAHDTYTAHQMVEHDDVNVLALGARVIGPALAAAVADEFVRASFTGEERHRRRLAKILEMERNGQ